MAWLKVYEWERTAYPRFRDIGVERSAQRKYIKKFARHFKVSEPLVEKLKPSARKLGVYYGHSHIIKLHETTNFGTLCHEFAHHLANMRYGGCQGHNRLFKRELKRTYTFAKRYLPTEAS